MSVHKTFAVVLRLNCHYKMKVFDKKMQELRNTSFKVSATSLGEKLRRCTLARRATCPLSRRLRPKVFHRRRCVSQPSSLVRANRLDLPTALPARNIHSDRNRKCRQWANRSAETLRVL
ncbi:Protein of unknown function [Gryllus bimaculatus]|nr:Protein of unknown function [Gryllus bimaculatus]